MPHKDKYLSAENLETEIGQILTEIRASGGRDRRFQVIGNPALLVTDMQEYFLSPESHAFIPSAEAIIPNILRLIKYFEEKGHLILYTQHLNTEEDAGNMKSWWREIITLESPYFQISPPFHPSTFPPVIQKFQYDAFHLTELEYILKKHDVTTLIICGVMTNLCCETTLRSAFVRGFNVIMPVDATAAYKREYHISTFVNLSFGFCPVKTTTEIIELLKK